jgi:hypothetical protein
LFWGVFGGLPHRYKLLEVKLQNCDRPKAEVIKFVALNVIGTKCTLSLTLLLSTLPWLVFVCVFGSTFARAYFYK